MEPGEIARGLSGTLATARVLLICLAGATLVTWAITRFIGWRLDHGQPERTKPFYKASLCWWDGVRWHRLSVDGPTRQIAVQRLSGALAQRSGVTVRFGYDQFGPVPLDAWVDVQRVPGSLGAPLKVWAQGGEIILSDIAMVRLPIWEGDRVHL